MSKSKSPSIEIPQYNQPAAQQYSMPGFGTTNYTNNTWGITEDPTQTAYRNQLETMRASVLKGLGITAPEREASLNQWQDTFTKEALRTSMPQLEQTMFARGMGGSKLYGDSVTDLLSKIGTQGVLNREQLSQSDEQLKLSQLASILGAGQSNLSNMSSLMGQATGQTNTNNQQAWNQYQALLPYLAKVNTPGQSGWGGALSGGMSGASAGSAFGPIGTIIGALIGGGTGYASSASGGTSTPAMLYGGGSTSGGGGTSGFGGIDLSTLASLFGGQGGQYANIAGMGQVPIAPTEYYKSAMGAF